jgi:hypothetical protein
MINYVFVVVTSFELMKLDFLKACNVIITQLASQRSHHSTFLTAPFTLFLWTNGASRQTIEALYKCKGGKEGQGLKQQQRKGGNSQKQTASTATKSESRDNYAFASSDMASITKQLNIPLHHRGAIIDSGTTSHFSPD